MSLVTKLVCNCLFCAYQWWLVIKHWGYFYVFSRAYPCVLGTQSGRFPKGGGVLPEWCLCLRRKFFCGRRPGYGPLYLAASKMHSGFADFFMNQSGSQAREIFLSIYLDWGFFWEVASRVIRGG